MSISNPSSKSKKGFFSSISGRFFIVMGILIFITVSMQTIVASRISLRSISKSAEQSVLNKVMGVSDTLQWRVSATLNLIVGYATSTELREKNSTVRSRGKFLDSIPDTNFNKMIGEYGKFRFYDLNGNDPADKNAKNVANEVWFELALKAISSVSEFTIKTPDGDQIVLLHATSVKGYDDEVIGVVAAEISREDISNRVNKIVVGETGYCYIVGGTGNIIAHSDIEFGLKGENIEEILKKDPEQSEKINFIRDALNTGKNTDKKSGIGYYTENGISYIGAWSKFQYDDFTTFVAIPTDEIFGPLYKMRIFLILIGVFSIVLSLIVLIFVVKGLTKPILRTTGIFKNMSTGDFTNASTLKGKQKYLIWQNNLT